MCSRSHLRAVGELEQVEVRVRHHDVLRLASNPTPHIHIPVGSTGAGRVDIEAHARVAPLARGAAAAGDVERDGADVADLKELTVIAQLDDLPGDLMAEDHVPAREGSAPPYHVLVRAADVGGDHL